MHCLMKIGSKSLDALHKNVKKPVASQPNLDSVELKITVYDSQLPCQEIDEVYNLSWLPVSFSYLPNYGVFCSSNILWNKIWHNTLDYVKFVRFWTEIFSARLFWQKNLSKHKYVKETQHAVYISLYVRIYAAYTGIAGTKTERRKWSETPSIKREASERASEQTRLIPFFYGMRLSLTLFILPTTAPKTLPARKSFG